jgi:hypothetical protein
MREYPRESHASDRLAGTAGLARGRMMAGMSVNPGVKVTKEEKDQAGPA